MNTWNRLLAIPFAALAFMGVLVCTGAQAGVIACHANTLSLVTNVTECEKSTTATQDFLNTDPMTVNGEQFFGFSDWLFLDKDEFGDNDGQSGSWAVGSSVWDNYSHLMLIFKDGNGTTLVGFLALDGATSGSWQSPFRLPEFDLKANQIKDVSHISYYVRGAVTRVPDTGSLILILMGLAFLGLSRMRTRAV